MKEIILIKNGEMALKGLNRSTFEAVMIKNLRRRLRPLGQIRIVNSQSTIMIEPSSDDFDFEEALQCVSHVFGIAAFSRAAVAHKDMDDILAKSVEYLADIMSSIKTFKVEAKRSDKHFPFKSPEICIEVGSALLTAYPHLSVDVHNPDMTVVVEIRDSAAYIRCGQIRGAGGMPVGTGGKAAVLISGGIDSPVAAWTMSKRGIELNAIHFASPPYTSERAELKVKKLLSKVAEYSGRINLAIVPFTEIQEQIAKNCPEEYFTLIMRRFMMKISERLAVQDNCLALITGESVGQVASQTLPALGCTDAVVSMPVLRPLIGMDKDEIVEISRKINTFDISIEPYEDCCTVFTPKHPRTRPTISQCENAESVLNMELLIDNAIQNTVYEYID
ncbi:MAG: tRNA 4-thiouridine(8) synthase ThiI [Oscillospiraceae bacterium]|nr:tRNA 4-thiouridine(8) synthase ThiI [Oscillospiraceae bacterium]